MAQKKPASAAKALKVRARTRNKKPAFVRPESWRDSKFSLSWRRPRGLDNKVRRKIKGWPASPSTGYKGPKIARGLHPSGFREVIVYNPKAVATVDSATQAVRIAHTVGRKKRALIIAEAKRLNVKILNVKIAKEEPKKKGEAAEAEAEEPKTEEAKSVEETAEEKPAAEQAEKPAKKAQKKRQPKKKEGEA
jgi:large subunit ribosomal protein L32e